jgi:mannose-1-phosphate guanylyltransferase
LKALLLAAGLGTRLRPITDAIPKCLVPIGNEPLLSVWLARLTSAGVSEILVNTHYLSDLVADYIENCPYRGSTRVTHEPRLLGTAGTLIANLEFFGNEDGLLIHGDNWCMADISEFIEAHKKRPPQSLMTMMCFRAEDPLSCGIVEIDRQGIIRGFYEKVPKPPGNLANGAIYALTPEFFVLMRQGFADATDFSNEVLPRLLGRMYAWETDAPFIDIGTPERYAQANEIAMSLHNDVLKVESRDV